MALVAIVISIALIQFIYFSILVGKARGTYGVDAPATSGDPTFECYHRVQQNTLEQLVVFIPAMIMFGMYIRPDIAAGIGAVYIIGRFIYLKAYVNDPKKRTIGFMLTLLPNVILILGGLYGAVMRVM